MKKPYGERLVEIAEGEIEHGRHYPLFVPETDQALSRAGLVFIGKAPDGELDVTLTKLGVGRLPDELQRMYILVMM